MFIRTIQLGLSRKIGSVVIQSHYVYMWSRYKSIKNNWIK